MVKTYRTNRNEAFLIDDADYDLANSFKWHVAGRNKTRKGCIVSSTIPISSLILLRALIRRRQTDPLAVVDHIDGNFLNNRRSNLRIVSRSDNNHFKWKNIALRRLRQGIKCSLKCDNLATSLIRLPARRYLYLCDDHLVTSRRRRHVIQK